MQVGSLDKLERSLGQGKPRSGGPHMCGDIDMRIALDCTFYYMGSPIGRKPLVRLFASVLQRDESGEFWLVTPAEMCRIRVEDAPFAAVGMTVEGSGRDQLLTFRTNLDEEVAAGRDHPIRVETDAATREPSPYVHVRGGLEALISRSVFYDLVELGVERAESRGRTLGVWSGGEFFQIGALDDA